MTPHGVQERGVDTAAVSDEGGLRLFVASDVADWGRIQEALDAVGPDAVVLAGDLASDGWIKKPHPEAFYAFLKHVAPEIPVFVLAGDHDLISGTYDTARVRSIPGVYEVTNKPFEVGGLRCFALGMPPRAPLTTIRGHAKAAGPVDVLITHVRIRHLHEAMKAFRPRRLVVAGHSGCGRYVVDGVPTVLSSLANHVEIHVGPDAVRADLWREPGSERRRAHPSVSPLVYFQDSPHADAVRKEYGDKQIVECVWPWLQPSFDINDPDTW